MPWMYMDMSERSRWAGIARAVPRGVFGDELAVWAGTELDRGHASERADQARAGCPSQPVPDRRSHQAA